MITLENDTLVFRFPELHDDARCRVDFQRTLRLPDDGNDYPLPPGRVIQLRGQRRSNVVRESA